MRSSGTLKPRMNCSDYHESPPKLCAFVDCARNLSGCIYEEMTSLQSDDELVLMVVDCPLRLCDKIVHGMVAYTSSCGFETTSGSVYHSPTSVSFTGRSLVVDECVRVTSARQLVRLFLRRPAPKTLTNSTTLRPVSELFPLMEAHLEKLVSVRSLDVECSLCSEDLVGIEELQFDSLGSGSDSSCSSDWPISFQELSRNRRIWSQPLQGYGHRPYPQQGKALRYRLTIVGVNQAGLLTFVHGMLIASGFRIIEASIETIRGSYATNKYLLETFCEASERLLRGHFQCVVNFDGLDDQHPKKLYRDVGELSDGSRASGGFWFAESPLSGYFGEMENRDSGIFSKCGFGRFWKAENHQSLASYTFEGEWEADQASGYGFELVDQSGSVEYRFGKYWENELVEGVVMSPFEPPLRSVYRARGKPDQCLYKHLLHRAEYWLHQLGRRERPIRYMPGHKLRPEVASGLLSGWMLFSESPVLCLGAAQSFQVAALLEAVGLRDAAKLAFAKRISGGLLEAMSAGHLGSILEMSGAQCNMLNNFLRALAQAHNIDRHMRQPAAVIDALANPSVTGKFFPLDQMRVVDSLGQGSFGKVIYAEYQGGQTGGFLSRTFSASKLTVGESTCPRTPKSVQSAPTRRTSSYFSSSPRCFVALKEQIGSRAEMENSCELVREWATLNALPHENIVRLEGICADTRAPMFNRRFLATALIEASLPALIYPTSTAPPNLPVLTPLLTLQLAGDIASGLAHMHSLYVLHGDIKSPNILVDLRAKNRPVARICDFGHAAIRIGPRPQRRMCTFGWAAPESLRDGLTDLSADVWSWAVVVWEMYAREVPWKGCSHPQMLAAVGHCGLGPDAFLGTHIPTRVRTEKKVSALVKQCWDFRPANRPRIHQVLKIVDKMGRDSANTVLNHLHSLLRG